MIMPIYDYANFCFTPCLDKTKTKLQRLQNRGLRICLRAQRLERINDLHHMARIATIENRRHFDILKLFHKKVYFLNLNYCEINILGPSLPEDGLHCLGNYTQTSTRSGNAPYIKTQRPQSEKFKRSLLYSGASGWNSLPTHLRNNSNYDSFKVSLRHHLFSHHPVIND